MRIFAVDGHACNTVGVSEGAALEVVLDALATYRLTRLVVEDEITAPLREKLWRHFDPGDTRIGYLFTCPWCVSFWVGAGVVCARTVAPKTWGGVARVLAFSAATGYIAPRI